MSKALLKPTLDLWCDHCLHRYQHQITEREQVLVCPHCWHASVMVTCVACEQRHEIASLAEEQSEWICPTCKTERLLSPILTSDYLATQVRLAEKRAAAEARAAAGPRNAAMALLIMLLICTACMMMFNAGWIQLRPIPIESSPLVQASPTPTDRSANAAIVIATAAPITPPPPLDEIEPLSGLNDPRLITGQPSEWLETLSIDALPHEILYRHTSITGQQRLVLWNWKTDEEILLKADEPDVKYRSLSWHPDGQKFIVQVDIDGESANNALLFDLDSADSPRPLFGQSTYYTDPTYSPDGRYIAVAHRSLEGGLSQLSVSSADAPMHNLYTWSGKSVSALAWAPDGSQLLTTHRNKGVTQFYIFDLRYRSRATVPLLPQDVREGAWSPDGSMFVFTARQNGNTDLYIADSRLRTETTAARTVVRLTKTTGSEHRPKWSPDGEYILFSANWDDAYNLYMMHRSGDIVVRLTNEQANHDYATWRPRSAP